MISKTLQSWKPSKIAKERIAKRRSTYIYKMDATPLAAVYIAILWLFMPISTIDLPIHNVDLARVDHPMSMPGALREDAILVSIERDGAVCYGDYSARNVILIQDLPALISSSLGTGSERKIYLRADARAKYGDVKAVIEALKKTGIENIALMVEQSAGS